MEKIMSRTGSGDIFAPPVNLSLVPQQVES